jgi:hypothetical protein
MNRILTESQVRDILAEWHRAPLGRRHGLQTYLARMYSVSVPAIRSIVTGRTWQFLHRGRHDAQPQRGARPQQWRASRGRMATETAKRFGSSPT